MRQVRVGVFETNSSSTHSLTICSADEFEKWKKCELVFDEYKEGFLTPEEADAKGDNDELRTYSEFCDNDELEYFDQSYTTKSGDKVVAFGLYGYN
jgi:hypothetical protein